MKSVLEQSRKVMGWKSRLMSLYFKSEEDTMKNEIPAAVFLVPPPPFCLRKNIYQIIEGFYYKLFSHYTCHCSFSIIKQ